jgi:hypothetical protein
MGCTQHKRLIKSYPAIAPIEFTEGVSAIAEFTMNALEEDRDLNSTVELSVSCQIEESHNCMIVAYSIDNSLKEIGRTEIQKSTSNPYFVTTFKVTYSFEKQSVFRFDLYSIKHSNLNSLLRQTLLGSAKYNIHEIVCASDKCLTKPLSKSGLITIFYDELSRLNHIVKIKLGVGSKASDGVYSLRLLKVEENRNVPVYITEGIENIPSSIF